MPVPESMPKPLDVKHIPEWPSLRFENRLWKRGFLHVAGIDEVGRGALAGPVYAGAVILPFRNGILDELSGVRDSKMMTPEEREYWAPIIQEKALAYSLGWASCKEIDRYGIVPATHLAARRALKALPFPPQYLLLDYIKLKKVHMPQTALIAGDARCLSISAASVIAKVARDAELRSLDLRYPAYGFASHKGYATDLHFSALAALDPCPQHRFTFAPLRSE